MRGKLIGILAAALAMLLLCLSVASCGVEESTTTKKKSDPPKGSLTVATVVGRNPYAFREDGAVVGMEIELAYLLAEEMNRTTVIKELSEEKLFDGLSSGSTDIVISAVEITEEMKERYDISASYLTAGLVLVTSADSAMSVADITASGADCKVGTVGLGSGRLSADIGDRAVDCEDMEVALTELREGRLSGLLADEYTAAALAASEGLRIAEGEYAEAELGIALKKGSDMLGQLNVVLKKIKSDGSLDNIVRKY